MAKAVVAAWAACVKDLQQRAAAAADASTPTPSAPGSSSTRATQDFGSFMQSMTKLKEQPPLPHAAWKKLVKDVQITAKLAALYVQALQQPHTVGAVLPLAFEALHTWLWNAIPAIQASPESHAAAAVRQQLQESQLLQHLGPAMGDAAAQLTAAVAALAAATGSCGSTSSKAGSSPTHEASIQKLADDVMLENTRSSTLLKLLLAASCAQSPKGYFSLEAALPVAPAALRLMTAVFQMHNMEPQMQLCGYYSTSLQEVYSLMSAVASRLGPDVPGTLQLCPGGNELLHSPELLPCLAIMLVVTVLGLDTSTDITEAKLLPKQQQRQQQQRQQADSSGSKDSGSGISNGVQLDSLTPLSCSLFDVLGITKETALHAAKLAHSQGFTNLPYLKMLLARYESTLNYQVQQANGVFDAQVLLQLETYLLLYLMMAQLTASIPDSYPGARPAHKLACHLYCDPLYSLCCMGGMRFAKLPQQSGYMGPQVALQLLDSTQAPPPQPPQQQEGHERREQQQQQAAEWLVVPSPTLLTELLPLLTRHCLAQLQQQQEGEAEASRTEQPRRMPPIWAWMLCLSTLVGCSVVPSPITTAPPRSTPQPPSALPAAAAAAGGRPTFSDHSCVLHAQDAFLPHASDIISIFEAALRLAAATCYAITAAAAAATAAVGEASAAASTAAAAAAEALESLAPYATVVLGVCSQHISETHPRNPPPLVLLALAAGPGSQVQRQLHSLLATMVKLSGWGLLNDRVRRQLRVAAADAAIALLADAAARQQQQQQCDQQVSAGAAAAAAVAAGAAAVAANAAAGEPGCSSGSAAATAMLPSVAIVGRCCMQWAENLLANYPTRFQQQQEEPISFQEQQQQQQQGCGNRKVDHCAVLSVVQQWLASGSMSGQLSAAGYAPLAVLQQQVSATCQVLQESAPDIAAYRAAVQQLQRTGLALCSFAVPCMCNNPVCTSLAGLSELASVSGRSCICGGCRVARYCGRACQRAAWKQHKPVCAALSAAVGGTGAEAVACARH